VSGAPAAGGANGANGANGATSVRLTVDGAPV